MKKISILFLMLVSVLPLWSQQPKEKENNPSKKIGEYISSIKDYEISQTVLDKAKDNGYIKKATSECCIDTLYKTVEVLTKLQSTCEPKEGSDTENSENEEAESTITNFLKRFHNDIFDESGKISISSDSFLKDAQDFRTKARSLLNNNNSDKSESDEESTSQNISGVVSEFVITDDSNGRASQDESFRYFWVLAILGLGATSIGFVSISLSVKRRVKDLEAKIRNLQEQLSQIDDRQMTPRHYATPLVDPRPVRTTQTPIHTNLHADSKPQTAADKYGTRQQEYAKKEPPKPCEYYATIDAYNPRPEFSKVSEQPSENSIFMISLDQADAETGNFRINPNLSAEYTKKMISNRSLYLPSNFVETESTDGTNHIEVISDGTVRKSGTTWTVCERMRIRLT